MKDVSKASGVNSSVNDNKPPPIKVTTNGNFQFEWPFGQTTPKTKYLVNISCSLVHHPDEFTKGSVIPFDKQHASLDFFVIDEDNQLSNPSVRR